MVKKMNQAGKLVDLLKKEDALFEVIHHSREILSVEDAREFFDVSKAAPVLILKTENGLCALIFSARRGRIDLKSLGTQLGYRKFKMAERGEVLEATGYPAGAVPLIIPALPCIFDGSLLENDFIYGGTGDACSTLKIAPADVKRVNCTVAVF